MKFTKTKAFVFSIILTILIFGITALGYLFYNSFKQEILNPPKSKPIPKFQPTNFGQGVYHFPGKNFKTNLAVFIKKHPEIKLVSLTEDYPDGGYIVIFKKDD